MHVVFEEGYGIKLIAIKTCGSQTFNSEGPILSNRFILFILYLYFIFLFYFIFYEKKNMVNDLIYDYLYGYVYIQIFIIIVNNIVYKIFIRKRKYEFLKKILHY